MTTLKLDQVSKLYRATARGGGLTPALRKVSFDLRPGEVIALIGESGSGKTTIGKILLRLVQPTSGTVTFDGKDIASYSPRGLKDYYRHVQGVFQDPFSSYNPIYRADRVYDLVRESYFPKVGDKQWSAKVEQALDAVALNPADVLGKYPHQLSGGQQQRLLIARALLLDVKVLIADEIISMLDASTRVDVLNLLVKLKRQGLAILFITHDLSLGNYVSDRTIILRHGAIVEIGATEKIFGNPQHEYTRMLLSAVPELHKKWQHSPLGPVAANGSAEASPNGSVATALTRATMLDELTHAEQVVKRDLRAVLGGGRAVASGKSQVAVALEPPTLHEFEPDHLVADPE
jgi:ABC-type microcin C transport system duplicated ATPase subunit YejF